MRPDDVSGVFPDSAMEAHSRVLERIASGAPLGEVMGEVVALVEQQLPGAMCSVLLLDADGVHLRLLAGASLPAAYNAAIDGIAIGPAVGSCGTAAWHGETVDVQDIATDPLWADFRDLALAHGLRSCISMPIFAASAPGSGNRVLGTFALYRRELVARTSEVLDVLHRAAHLAGVAIEREQATRAIRSSEERFRLFVDGVHDYALLLTDAEGRVVMWNQGAQRTFGYREDEVLGRHIERFHQGDADPDNVARALLRRTAAEGRTEVEGWRVRRDGEVFWAHVVTTALRREDGSLRGFANVVHDRTEHRRLEEQLRQAAKMEAVGRLAGGVAHDFNNLLTVINGCADMLNGELADDDPHLELVASIREAGQHAADLTRQLLAFSRKVVIEPRDVDVNAIVAATGEMLRRLIGNHVGLETVLCADACTVRADPVQLEQVVLNLVVNARDAMPDGGRLTVRTATLDLGDGERQGEAGAIPAGRYVELSVTDTGHGIPEPLRARIFEPFFTTKGVGHGTGLGLATVYGIVKQAGGDVSVVSEVGEGTTFRVLLPAISASFLAEPARAVRSTPSGTETILLVEDDDAVRRLAHAILSRYGYRILAARNGTDALRVLAGHAGPLALLLTDVAMPGMGGAALAALIRGQRPEVRVLYMSGHADDSPVRRGATTDGGSFLNKPFTRLELAHKVRDVLDGD
jgi:two-component system cell cycle sensor histidine kinase/response regulator CckA